jgi:hypothetical protein
MNRGRLHLGIFSLLVCVGLAGCRGKPLAGSQSISSGNSAVVLAMTDTPPSTVTILSAKVTLTGATLSPGNIPLFSGSTTVDLIRLQTDFAYIATATKVAAGSYTSVKLTFANPMLTIENDTGSKIISGTTTCAVGAICTIAPTSVANLSATIPLSAFTITSGANTGLLIDVNLDNLLSSTLGADFDAGTTVTSFTPAGTGAPPVGAEDIVGQVGSISASSSSFTLTNATESYSLKVESSSTFFAFPTTACTTAGFSCLKNNQIVSVDIGILADGTLEARNIVFEDADNSDAEIEGMITSTNAGSQQFNMVIQTMSIGVSGLSIGEAVTVQYSISPQTPFDIDFVHIDNTAVNSALFPSPFTGPADLAVGQQVSIRLHTILAGGQLMADRVLLRSTRITASVGRIAAPNIDLDNLPSLFSGHGVTQITAQTLTVPATIYFEIGKTIIFTNIAVGELVSARGPLFNVNGVRTLLATKVVVK